MKIYTVHIKPTDEKRLENAVFVPEAFSLPAIIFPINFIWAILNRAWLFLILLLVYFFSGFLPLAHEEIGQPLAMFKLALFPFLGIFANDFWRYSLKRRGYKLEAVVSGRNEPEAQLRYFETVNKV